MRGTTYGDERGPRARVVLIALTVVATFSSAHADEASGRWSGRAELRSSSFRERNTSILAPTIGLRLDSPRGTTVRGTYLADAITSASVSVDVVTGASVTADPLGGGRFHELRQEGSLGVEHGFSFGERDLTVSASAHTSHERDYYSYAGTAAAALSLDERNLVLGLSTTYLHDEVRYVEHGIDGTSGQTTTSVRPLPGRTSFDGVIVTASLERLLGPRAVLGVGYDLGYLAGYLGNPYRIVQVDARLARESVPTTRLRHSPWVNVRVAFPAARSAIHLALRGYTDDWHVRAFTAEARYYQDLSRYLMLRLRYRGYAQSASYFESGLTALIPTYPDGTRFTTSNPRYAAMTSHEPGLALLTSLGFLGRGGRSMLESAEIEFSFDYRIATNRFGNALFGGFVLRLPLR